LANEPSIPVLFEQNFDVFDDVIPRAAAIFRIVSPASAQINATHEGLAQSSGHSC